MALASFAARLTAKGTNSPASASTTISAIVWPALSWASTVDAPRCGATTTFSSAKRGDSVVGSSAKTSSAGARDRAGHQGVGERLLVDDAAPRGVHDPQLRLGPAEQLGIEQPDRLGCLRQVDREEVHGLDQAAEVGLELHAELAGPVRAHVRVVGHEPHPEGEAPLGDEHADPTEADDAERLAVQLDAGPAGAVPLARLQVAVGLGQVARLREQQRHRLLGRGDHVRLGGVDHHHAARRGRGDVDVVETDAGTTDDDEIGARPRAPRRSPSSRCGSRAPRHRAPRPAAPRGSGRVARRRRDRRRACARGRARRALR